MPAQTPSSLISVAEARARLFALAPSIETETIPIREAASRWAADDILALRTQPVTDLSAMDGYAIRFADLPGGSWRRSCVHRRPPRAGSRTA